MVMDEVRENESVEDMLVLMVHKSVSFLEDQGIFDSFQDVVVPSSSEVDVALDPMELDAVAAAMASVDSD